MDNDLLYQLSLCKVPAIGNVHAKALTERFDTAREIFMAKPGLLEKIEGIGPARAANIRKFRDFAAAEKEIAFIRKYHIQCLFIRHPDYPYRLRHCEDPPTMLFYRGTADLNAVRILAIVGTRNHTEYGKIATEKLVKELAPYDVTVVSGLAFGIDAVAHKAALRNHMPTVGVMAHGLDTVYPGQHTGLARQMLQHGGLLTEFPSHTKPNKHHFPSRNRIVAGLSDATVVIESGNRGGSIITADLACGYNREVFALPGRNTDVRSRGCNELIRINKAALLTETTHFTEMMGWQIQPGREKTSQAPASEDLPGEEKKVLAALTGRDKVSTDEIIRASGLPVAAVSAALLNLELRSLIRCSPGKRYTLSE